MAVTRTTQITACLALLGCLLAIALIITVSIRPIYLTEYGPYSTSNRIWYTTIVTIAASAFASFVTSQIRLLWVGGLDEQFARLVEPMAPVDSDDIPNLQRKWDATMGVASLVDSLRHWKVTASFLGTSLITAAIVTSLTPTSTGKNFEYMLQVSSGLPYGLCAMIIDDPPEHFYRWNIGNGSTLGVNPLEFGCPLRLALGLMGGINPEDPDVYAYSDRGVAIHTSAIGAPVAVYGSSTDLATVRLNPSLSQLLKNYGSDVLSTTQCVRTMVSNPVSCEIGGSVQVGSYGITTVKSSDGTCSISASDSSGYYMYGDICTHKDIGRATIVIGAMEGYATRLAQAVGESNSPGPTLAVTCAVDANDVFRYRNLTLNFRDNNGITETNLGRQLNGSAQDCEAFRPEDNLALLAIASVATQQSLSQYANSGFFDSINQLTTNFGNFSTPRTPPFGFSRSRNALEDVLGLTTALVTSRLNSTLVKAPATAVVVISRVGAGGAVGLVYILPPLFSALVLIVLLVVHGRGDVGVSSIKLEDLMTAKANM